jgi:hypothetical protein
MGRMKPTNVDVRLLLEYSYCYYPIIKLGVAVVPIRYHLKLSLCVVETRFKPFIKLSVILHWREYKLLVLENKCTVA